MERRVKGMEQDLQEVKDSLIRMASDAAANRNTNTIRIQGAGSIWNGFAIGIALGAVVVGAAWIISTQQRLEMLAEQSKAYSAAVYALSPRFAEQIDKELEKQKEAK